MKKVVISLFLVITLVCQAQTYLKFRGSSTVLELKNSPVRVTQPADLQFTTTTASSTCSFQIRGLKNSIVKVDWGDGTTSNITFTSQLTTISHTYSIAGTYNVYFTGATDKIYTFTCSDTKFTGNINSRHSLWTGLRYYSVSDVNFKGGNINSLNVKDSINFNCGTSSLSINYENLSDTLKYLGIASSTSAYITKSGSLDSISKTLKYLSISASSFTNTSIRDKVHIDQLSPYITNLTLYHSGDSIIWTNQWNNKVLKTLSLYSFYNSTSKTRYSFVVDSLPNTLTVISFPTAIGITGNFNYFVNKCTNLVNVNFSNNSTTTASINSYYTKLTSIQTNSNTNWTNNDIQYLKNCTSIIQFSNNGTTLGCTDSLSKCTYQDISGSVANYSGCYGNVAKIPSAATFIRWSGFGSITYDGSTLPAFSSLSTFTLSGNMTEAQLRLFLINWAAVATNKACTCNFDGTNAALHINATDDPTLYNAYTTLQSLGKTFTINTY